MKELWKSAKIWRNYHHERVACFLGHSVYRRSVIRMVSVQRGNFHVDDQLYNLSPLNDPKSRPHHRSRANEGPTSRVSIDGVDHVISPVSLEDIRLYDSATPLRSRSSGIVTITYLLLPSTFVVQSVTLLGEVGTDPPGWQGQLESGERVGVVRWLKNHHLLRTLTGKKSSVSWGKNRVTSSVTAPADTNPSDATVCVQ